MPRQPGRTEVHRNSAQAVGGSLVDPANRSAMRELPREKHHEKSAVAAVGLHTFRLRTAPKASTHRPMAPAPVDAPQRTARKQIYSMRHVLPRGRSSTHNSGRVDGPGGGRARGRFKGLLACKLEWLGRRKRQRCLAFPIDRDAREREGPRTASRCSPSASYCRKVEVSVGAKGVIDRDCSLFYVRCEEGVVGSVVKR